MTVGGVEKPGGAVQESDERQSDGGILIRLAT
jgi:hypothetical protein